MLPVRFKDNVFRLLQAALSNIRRHSGEDKANITVEFAPGCLQLSIEDNGRGFNVPKETNWFAKDGKLGLSACTSVSVHWVVSFIFIPDQGQGLLFLSS